MRQPFSLGLNLKIQFQLCTKVVISTLLIGLQLIFWQGSIPTTHCNKFALNFIALKLEQQELKAPNYTEINQRGAWEISAYDTHLHSVQYLCETDPSLFLSHQTELELFSDSGGIEKP